MRASYLKLFISFFTLIFLSNMATPSYANEPPTNYFNKIIFFGDSLTDNGNLYWIDWGFLPKSPPYFDGHFTNGNVWSEYVSQYYYHQNMIGSTNFAFGGLTAIFHNPIHGFLPYSLTLSIDNYLLHSAFRDRSHTLFVLWLGANDYLPGTDKADQLTTDVVGNIKYAIENLIYHGGLNFLVINLPNLSSTPYAKINDMVPLLSNLTLLHNTKLATAIDDIQNNYKSANIHLFNINQLMDDLLKNPDEFNKKYETHISDTVSSCWEGGYTLRTAQNNEAIIAQQLEEQINKQSRTASFTVDNQSPDKNLDTSAFAHYITTTPTLLETYHVGEDSKLCQNPDNYVFWDRIHPTTVIHMMLSKELIAYINSNYQPL